MIKVNIDIVPFGDEARARPIGTLTISRREVRANPCDYDVRYMEPGCAPIHAIVRRHVYADGALRLIKRAINEIVIQP